MPKTNLVEFIDSVSDEDVVEAYVSLFCDVEGEHSRTEAESLGYVLLDEIRDAIAERKDLTDSETYRNDCDEQSNDAVKRFIFSTMITDPGMDDEHGPEKDVPIVDISLMRYSSIARIPDYMSSHPSMIEYSEVQEDYEIRDFVYEPNLLSYPILLTPLDELMSYDVYFPDGDDFYPVATAASLLYEMSLFGGSIEECESKKKEISDTIRKTAEENGYEFDNADEILQTVTGTMDPDELGEDVFLERMLTARYNARIGIYDRIYCDAMLASQVHE